MRNEARDELWNLVLTARFDLTRALALVELSKLDPERFNRIRDIVHGEQLTVRSMVGENE